MLTYSRRFSVCIVNFEHNTHLFLVFLLLLWASKLKLGSYSRLTIETVKKGVNYVNTFF